MNIVTIYEIFPTNQNCLDHIEKVRWNGIPKCPYCQSTKTTPAPKEHRHHCNNCNTSFSVTVRTIFHNNKLPMQKWFLALALTLNAKKGLSARQLGRDLNINKDTAWRMAMKIRDAMARQEERELLTGIVEADETYIGGKPRKGTKDNKRGRGTKKTPVVGMIERNGKVKAQVIKNHKLNKDKINSIIRENINKDATLITDEFKGYNGVKDFMKHYTIDHSIWYVDGEIHTNSIESFWALLKRGIIGQYHKVSIKYLQKYIDEFCYRFSLRNHYDLFGLTLKNCLNR